MAVPGGAGDDGAVYRQHLHAVGSDDRQRAAGDHADRMVLAGEAAGGAAEREGDMEQSLVVQPSPARKVLDVSGVPSVAFGARSVTWWGVAGLMAIEGMVFALMV